ncbi:ABC transporter permease [Bacillus suaedae]|uniref:ABC transporter permease n=1 Tax=Halalkalibacter suaedae TaxID=2822140 RepID=A0A940WZQ4_9BACI|nr:ABC transporter permease [Bacillus suaedae]MBP3951756.1 ABC transporter permease [Bacillus suaedae]
MIDLRELYTIRKKEDERQQKKLLAFFFDWTILFYILLVGAVLIGIYIYSWLTSSDWLSEVPFRLIHLSIFIVVASTSLRIYFKEADQLFLIRNTSLMNRMIKIGYNRLIVFGLIKATIAIIILLPFFLLNFNVLQMVFYIMMVLLFTVFYLLYLNSNWRRRWLTFCIFVIYLYSDMHVGMWIVISILSLILAMYLVRKIDYRAKLFNKWLEIDMINGAKLLKWLFRLSSLVMMMNGIKGVKGESDMTRFIQKHWTMKGRIFKERSQSNVLLETFLKWFQRQPTVWVYFLDVCILTTVAFWLLPAIWMVIIVALISCFIMKRTLNTLWTLFLENPFMKLYRWDKEHIINAKQKARILFLMSYGVVVIAGLLVKLVF